MKSLPRVFLLFAVLLCVPMLVGWKPPPADSLDDDEGEVIREHCAIVGLLDVPNASAIDLHIKCLVVTEKGMRVRRAPDKRLNPNKKGEFWTPFDVKSYFTLSGDQPTLHFQEGRGFTAFSLTRSDGHWDFRDVIAKLGNDNQ